jgi:hypothetical protein
MYIEVRSCILFTSAYALWFLILFEHTQTYTTLLSSNYLLEQFLWKKTKIFKKITKTFAYAIYTS